MQPVRPRSTSLPYLPISRRTAFREARSGLLSKELDTRTVLVEFADDEGRAYAIAACPINKLLVLRYARQAA